MALARTARTAPSLTVPTRTASSESPHGRLRDEPHARIDRLTKIARYRSRGQGMTEYIIVVALISVAAIGVYSLFGQTVRNQVSGMALEMAGQNGNKAIQAARKSADEAASKADAKRGLGDYTAGNH